MKKLLKIIASTILCCSMLLPSMAIFAAENNEMKELENLRGLGGNWSMADAITCYGGGDMFALSDTEAENFVFETDVEFVAGPTGAASLVFYSGTNPSRGSYVANIDLSAGNARIFRFESTGGATTKGEFVLTSEMRAKTKFNLRVEAQNGNIIYSIDGRPVIKINDSSVKHGKYLGLLDYNTSLKYTNLRWGSLEGESAPVLKALTGDNVSFNGSNSIKQSVPFGTKSVQYTADPAKGTISASVLNSDAKASVNGRVITVTDITESFEMLIKVSDGDLYSSYVITVNVENDPDSVYNEKWRPQLHFSPFVNWLNDPNGLVFDPSDNTWHLFFQYNPYGLNIANQVWGHAVSTDLMHWKELDVAIPQDYLGAVFSGSAVVDENNTTGFFTDNKPGESRLVALYTSDGGDTTHGVEKQCIAYSKDHGVTWVKPKLDIGIDNNIVISNANNKYGRDFRDPKIFRYDGKWFMVIAGGRARLFTSDDLINWTFACDMGFDSECPDFYPLAVDGDENNIKWVYTASGKWYVVGRLEKVQGSATEYKFVQEGSRITYNGGNQMYATQSFYNDGSGADRRIAISWIQDNSAPSLSGKTWNGAMSIPYEQTLRTVNGKIILTSYPVEELDALHGSQIIDLSNPSADKINEELEKNPSVAYDAEIKFKPTANTTVEFKLRSNGAAETVVSYSKATNKLRVVRSGSASVAGNFPTEAMEMPLYPDSDGYITVRIVMDTTVIEVFGNNGEAPMCGMIFPDVDGVNSSITVKGETEIESFDMWEMTSIWHKDDVIKASSGIYFELSDKSVSFDKTTAITAFVINDEGRRIDGTVTFSGIDEKLVTVEKNEKGVLQLIGKAKGKLTITAKAGDMTETLKIDVADIGFNTNVEGWPEKGAWSVSENGYTISASSGDTFAISETQNSGEFKYSGDAIFTHGGGCLGLVFGVANPQNPGSATWYGANIDTHGPNPTIKLFCNTGGQESWNEILTLSSNAEIWNLEVKYENKILTYTVNGESVSHELRKLPSGNIGLVTWNGGGSFDNVMYSSLDEIVDDGNNEGNDGTNNDPQNPEQNEGSSGSNQNENDNQKPKDTPASKIIIPVAVAVAILAVVGIGIGIVIGKKRKA